ncbi:MAG TPA: TetR/AcrR family transcriptional regulator, partial [Pseudonocardiaceae bacterium]|nr:TetR/AcrR family transcriptional regulator [Pseudonocardiaceae bacterium]
MVERTGRRIRGLDADQRRAQRQDDLLAAALDLFAAAGYPNTSIEQICQAAFVGTKGFYEIFDSKEACYIALLRQVSATIEARMVEALRTLPDDEPAATEVLLSSFAHALVDDPRFAKVTFGQAGGISPAVERQRRENRRWAADFLTSVWQRNGAPADPSLYRVAIGVIGGLFDLVADWML